MYQLLVAYVQCELFSEHGVPISFVHDRAVDDVFRLRLSSLPGRNGVPGHDPDDGEWIRQAIYRHAVVNKWEYAQH